MHDDSFDDMSPELLATLDRVRARYGEAVPPAAGPRLSAFLSVGLTNDKGDLPATAASNVNEPAVTQVVGLPNWRTTLTQRRRQFMRTIAAFIGTTLGKVVLGTTVAAASVGAGQASGVLDVNGDPAPTEHITVDDELDTPEVEADDVEADEVDADDAEPDDAEADDQGEDADDVDGVDDQGEDAGDQGDDEADDVEADEIDDEADEIDDEADADEIDDEADADEIDDEADADEVDDDATEVDEPDGDELETDD